MGFVLRKPNAAWTDLKPEDVESYNRITDLGQSSAYGFARIMRPAVIVQIIQDFGGERAVLCAERFGARGMNSLDRLQSLLEGKEPLEFEPEAKYRGNERPGSERKGALSVGSEPRSFASLVSEPRRTVAPPPPTRKYAKPFTLDEAHDWLLRAGYAKDNLLLYFSEVFVQNKGMFYQLREGS